MSVVHVNGVRLFYEMEGSPEGPPVLFISGLSGDHRRWAGVVSSLAPRYRCIAFDNRDSGHSDRVASPYDIGDMARDAAGLVHELGLPPVHVVGYSMGGAIAQELALGHPEVVDRLVLVATYTYGDERGKAMLEEWGQLRRLLSQEEYALAMMPWLYTQEECDRPGFAEELVRRAVEDDLYQEPDAYDRQARATLGFRSEERLRLVSHPTLLVFGEEDIVTSLRFAQRLHEGIPSSRLVTLPGAGHGLLVTRYGEVASAIGEFLAEGAQGHGSEG